MRTPTAKKLSTRARGRRVTPRGAAAAALAALVSLVAGTPSAVAALPWLPPAELIPTGASSVGPPAVADDGTAVAAFSRVDGGVARVYAALRTPGNLFGAPAPLSDTTAASTGVQSVIDRQGNATVAWIQGGVVKAAYHAAGGEWGPPQPLSATDGTTPTLAAGSGGGAAISWYSNTSPFSSQRAVVAVRDPGQSTFSSAVPVSSSANTGGLGVYPPSVGMSEAGDVIAAWSRDVDSGGTAHRILESAIRPAGGAFSGVSAARSSAAGNASVADVAVSPDGRAFVVWSYTDGVTPQIQFSERAPGGSFGAASSITSPGSNPSNPRSAISDSGTVALTWTGTNAVMSAVKPLGGAFSASKPLSGAGALATAASVAIGKNGHAVIAWPTNSSADYALFAATRGPNDEGFGNTTEVVRGQGATPATVYFAPYVDVDEQGNAFLTTLRYSAGPMSYAAVVMGFDAAPPTFSAVTIRSAATTGAPASFSATATDRMSTPAFAWDFGDGATATGSSVSHAFAGAGVFAVKVTATDGAGNVVDSTRSVQVSAPAVPPPGLAPAQRPLTVLTAPKIKKPKQLKIGARLSVPASLSGATALKFQWLRSGKAIKKATKRTYKVAAADRTKKLSCRITATVGGHPQIVVTKAVKIPKR